MRDCHTRQTTATRERIIADGNDGIRDRHARQATATPERISRDGSDRIRNNRIFTSRYQRVRSRFNNGITVASGIVYNIATFHCKVRQVSAIPEQIIADGSDRIRDFHARQTTAVIEHTIADGNDGMRDRHARQATAILERDRKSVV